MYSDKVTCDVKDSIRLLPVTSTNARLLLKKPGEGAELVEASSSLGGSFSKLLAVFFARIGGKVDVASGSCSPCFSGKEEKRGEQQECLNYAI